MAFLRGIREKKYIQYLLSLALILLISLTCLSFVHIIGYRVVALILLLAVSILAMIFDIIPVMISAIFSALFWNFFFIPPFYNFTISSSEDVLLFLMYFAIALVNAVLTARIRKAEASAREKEEKEKTIRMYNTVLNSLSHELRTPISTIIGAVDALKDSHINLSGSDRSDLLAEIDIASTRLNMQVENLLNMSRLESGFIKPQPDWCDLPELVHRIIQRQEMTAGDHVIRFNPEEGLPLFYLDAGLVEQVMRNLVRNALQYTPEGSVIDISVLYNGKECVIEIADNGPGFPEGQIEAVFEKFYRLKGSAPGGTGLGLSIVKGLVEAMNGRVKLENLPGSKGAKFIISIPSQISNISDFQNE